MSPEDYPPEDDQLGDLDQCETFSVPNVLTISEAELMAEWDNWSQEHDSSEIPVVLVLLGVMATLATCLGAVILCRCRCAFWSNQVHVNSYIVGAVLYSLLAQLHIVHS